MYLPTANLPPPTPIREENQTRYSGQLANGLGVPCRYSWLIWSQSDDGAMSTQAACHSGGLTQKDESEAASSVRNTALLTHGICVNVNMHTLICAFFITDAAEDHSGRDNKATR